MTRQNGHRCTSEMSQKAVSRLISIYAHGVFINVDIEWLWILYADKIPITINTNISHGVAAIKCLPVLNHLYVLKWYMFLQI